MISLISVYSDTLFNENKRIECLSSPEPAKADWAYYSHEVPTRDPRAIFAYNTYICCNGLEPNIIHDTTTRRLEKDVTNAPLST